MTHRARWSRSLHLTSWLTSTVLVGISIVTGWQLGRDGFGLATAAIPCIVLLIAWSFTVRGYQLRQRDLSVRRLFWSTHVPLQSLERAWADPAAMSRSLRMFGNGGLYSFTGMFRNNRLGNFRAFVTDPTNSVVLQTEHQTLVISPESPGDFLDDLRRSFPDIGGQPQTSAPVSE